MKALLIILTSLLFQQAYAGINQITCKGYVDSGTMQGNLEVTVTKTGGTWMVNRINAGKNVSNDPNILEVDNYALLSCKGASALYDSNTNTLKFRYKYNSGYVGGGCQKTSGTFTDCSVE